LAGFANFILLAINYNKVLYNILMMNIYGYISRKCLWAGFTQCVVLWAAKIHKDKHSCLSGPFVDTGV
jgi:hypothetical protein